MMGICTLNFESGHIIGAYKLLLKCGQGAYGPVYLAENTLTGKQAALKIVAMTGSNFERELQGVIRYQQIAPGSGLLQIYHVEQQGDFFYYTMDAADNLSELPDEYIPDTLGNRLRRYGKLDPASVQIMAESLLKSLQILHSKKLCHRDIKPDNILFINGSALPGDVGLISDNASAISSSILALTASIISADLAHLSKRISPKIASISLTTRSLP